MAADQIVVPALGRPFTLGMLYDARKEQIFPGVTIWDEENLQAMTKKCDQHSSDFQITKFNSLEEKTSLLDMNASIKASFMGGLIDVEGSAKFLNDRKQSFHQSRVTFQYNATTIFEQLMLSAADIRKNQQLSNLVRSSATHLVTGILHGATAFFVFDSEASDVSSVQDLEGSMQAVIKLIPSFNVEGKVDIKLTDSEKSVCDKMTCKFYGDFLLESNPATFEEAVKSYTDLPKLLIDKKENGVPVKVWMMPLQNLTPSAARVMADISPDTVGKIQDALEAMDQLKIRCNKCLEDRYHFPSIHEKLNSFKHSCDENITKIQDMLAENIPPIRAGEKPEEELLKLTDDKEKPPFNIKELKERMKNIEREVVVIRSCEEMMKEAKIITSTAELDEEIFNPEVDEVLCFVFTSLETKDSPPKENKPAWYYDNKLIAKAREKARMLGDLARALKSSSRYRCVVAEISDPQHEGATIYHYRQNELLSKDFNKPEVPDVEKITARRDLIWYATELTLDPDTAHPNVTLQGKTATHGNEPQPYPDLPQRFDQNFQVFCKEKLDGQHYWEVEWSLDNTANVGAAVCYGSMKRKGFSEATTIGANAESWIFGYLYRDSGEVRIASFFRNHENKLENIDVPMTGCPRVGFFLDWIKGSLSIYIVTGEQLSHIYTFKETTFSEAVYPALEVWNENNFAQNKTRGRQAEEEK
uniref:B30.2/SPRY domain-containing protein n=1 Tax=Poecilia mexicana TaxID=48701 RepID=A0A3B3WKZ0_9TELE